MADWVYLTHPDIDTEPHKFPNDPDSLQVYEARGWTQVDPPEETPFVPPKVEADESERDIHGVAWVTLQHTETGGVVRVPDEPGVIEDHRDRGWRLAGEADSDPDVEVEAVELDYDEWTQQQLRDALTYRELPVSGTKQEQIDRLRQDDEAGTEPTADSGDTEKE